MEYKDLPPEFGSWLGRQKERFVIFVEPVKGSGAFVTVESDPEQFKAAYNAHRDVFISQAVKNFMEKEETNK